MGPERIDDPELAWLAALARALIGAGSSGDLAQDALLAEIERPAPAGVPRRAWLTGIARRLASRDQRGRVRRRDRELRAPSPEPAPAPDELLERAEAAAAVSAAARELPEPFRRAVLLRYLEGMEPREIADADGIPVDTVRWRLRRGLALLRQPPAPERDDMGAFLLPLAAAGGRSKAPAAALAAASFPLFPLTIMSKALALTLASTAAILATLALAGGDDQMSDPEPARTQDLAPARGGAAVPSERTATLTPPPDDAERAPEERGASAPAEAPPGAGLVVDAATNEPVEGASVAWLGEDGVALADGRAVTGSDGRFLLEVDGRSDRIGVTANGHRRQVFEVTGAERPWRITLDRGRVLEGRLLDADRVPVAGVEVLALVAGAGVSHMSPTQRRLRRRSREEAFDGAPIGACRAVSGPAGDVRFSGLADDSIELLSLDPAWAVVGPGEVDAAATHVEWTLESRIGVRVAVVDAAGAPFMDRVRSTFFVDLAFEDGSQKPVGQWVGRGEGEIAMSLSLADLGDIDGRTPVSATFRGVATTESDRAEWRSDSIALEDGWKGVAAATARFGATYPVASEDALDPPAPEVATAELELDVVHPDGTPCIGALNVAWNGSAGRGDLNPQQIAPGRYLASLPADVNRVTVQRRFSQGSIGPWVGEVELDPARRARVEVTLRRGARVAMQRPLGFDGNWHVHASWRDEPDGPWRGSWGYGTDEDTLVLEAIDTAEWRFTARRRDAPGEDDLVTTVELSEGDDVRVTW